MNQKEILQLLEEELQNEEKDFLWELGEYEYGSCNFDSNQYRFFSSCQGKP